MRLEAINLLGKYIRGSKDLEIAYYDIVAASLGDSSVSVRKAALRLMWEAYVIAPESGKANEACQLILQLASDSQDLNCDMVVKLIRDLWFCPCGEPSLLALCIINIEIYTAAFSLSNLFEINPSACQGNCKVKPRGGCPTRQALHLLESFSILHTAVQFPTCTRFLQWPSCP